MSKHKKLIVFPRDGKLFMRAKLHSLKTGKPLNTIMVNLVEEYLDKHESMKIMQPKEAKVSKDIDTKKLAE